jgi:hypothetical protein
MLKIITLLTITMIFGCTTGTNDEQNIESESSTTDSNAKPKVFNNISIAGCYMQILKRDTFAAILQQQQNLVSGRMRFNNYEKDASAGTVSGKLEGDILKLDYTFTSEGMKSVMELYFKYNNGDLIRGTGEMNTKGDTAYFTNLAQIKYDGGEFKKTECETFPTKYR